MAEVIWWPGWRTLIAEHWEFAIVVVIATTMVGGYVTAWWLASKAERYERNLAIENERRHDHEL